MDDAGGQVGDQMFEHCVAGADEEIDAAGLSDRLRGERKIAGARRMRNGSFQEPALGKPDRRDGVKRCLVGLGITGKLGRQALPHDRMKPVPGRTHLALFDQRAHILEQPKVICLQIGAGEMACQLQREFLQDRRDA